MPVPSVQVHRSQNLVTRIFTPNIQNLKYRGYGTYCKIADSVMRNHPKYIKSFYY